MKRDELDQVFGETPQMFSDRIDATLRDLTEEERPVKKLALRTVLLAALLLVLLCAAAYGIVSGQGLAWYYDNVNTMTQETEPEKYRELMENLQTDVPQTGGEDAEGVVSVRVQDYAWAQDSGVFTFSLVAAPNDPEHIELHPMMSMDADGWDDERTVHWLWTNNGFGLPADVMDDPSKQLMLFEADDMEDITIGDTGIALPSSSYFATDGEDGTVMYVPEFLLARFDPDKLAESVLNNAAVPNSYDAADMDKLAAYAGKTLRTEGGVDQDTEAVKRLQEALTAAGYDAGEADGAYDETVTAAVMAFQTAVGLTPDGIAGPYTQAVLFDGIAVAMGKAQVASSLERSLAEAVNVRDAMNTARDEDGLVTLRLHYTVTPFDKEHDSFGDPIEGTAAFKVQMPME